MNRPALQPACGLSTVLLLVTTLAALLPGCASGEFTESWAVPEPEAVAMRRSAAEFDRAYTVNANATTQGVNGDAGIASRDPVLADPSASAGGDGGDEASPSLPRDPESAEAAPTKRLVIYTAQLHILVPSAKESLAKLLSRVEQLDGYMQSRSQNAITVRVPAKTFDSILDEAREYGKITHEKIDALDVTRQFRDMTIRLETAEKSRQRLLAILAKAEKVEDVLKIEEQLRRLIAEIELMKGELLNLSDRIAFSTITVVFQQNAPEIESPPRLRSRFDWINRVGVEQVLNRF